MSTSRITFRRRVRRGALALAVSAICLPSCAYATYIDGDDPGVAGYVGTHVPVAPEPSWAGDMPGDFPGMPGSPVVVSEPAAAPEGDSFDWTSAALGAAGGGLLVVVSLGAAGAVSRIRMRAVRS
jgi:hypothetical protein